MSIEELLERARAATGPDREIDLAIFKIAEPGSDIFKGWDPEPTVTYSEVGSNWKWNAQWGDSYSASAPFPKFTGSLDAIVGLIEEELPAACWDIKRGFGYEAVIWFLERDEEDYRPAKWRSQYSPALALCAAFLSALLAAKATP